MMADTTSIRNILGELRAHAEHSGDDSLLDLVGEMETKLAENEPVIKVGNISNSTAVAIGNGIDIVVHQSNVPEVLVMQLENLLKEFSKPAVKQPEWTRGKSPFPGLHAFGEEYAPVFFGRQAETEQLIARLSKPDCRFLMVVGASGSGKSSLVKAGLIPRLREGALYGSENWKIITFTPDAFGKGDPFDVLAYALSQALTGLDIPKAALHLRDHRSGLRDILDNSLSGSETHAVLFIDQFEEIFSRVIDGGLRKKFQASISNAANSPRILIIATLRDDFYQHCVQSPVLSRLINRNTDSTFTLSAPGQLEMYEMITGPARVADLQIENGLVHQILDDTGNDPGALALMAYALDQLYKVSGSDGQLTLAEYQTFGGVQRAIGTRAQETFDALSLKAQNGLPRVFRELLEVDESGTATRKRTPLERVERDDGCHELVQGLVKARLLVTSRATNNQAFVEVAHEALFRCWPALKAWIEEAQDDLILLRQVRTAADWWNKHGRQSAYLWPDERLQPVYAMRRRLLLDLNDIEKEFIRSEFERLMDELKQPATPHRRRSAIGERLESLSDPRPGIGLVHGILPLYADEKIAHTPADLGVGEIRLWGDKPEHAGLPDIVWLLAEGQGTDRIEVAIESYEHLLPIWPFYVAKYPITYKQFQAFVDASDGFRDLHWWKGLSAKEEDKDKPGEQNIKIYNYPRETVSWYDAIAFCRWLNARLNWPEFPAELSLLTLENYTGIRLPTEWEWKWVASGGYKDYMSPMYPWGTQWDGKRANTKECHLSRTTAVGMYPAGAAKCGTLDMSGNVWEWCLNEYYSLSVGLEGTEYRVLCGGSWDFSHISACVSYRFSSPPNIRDYDFGFRLVVRSPSL